MDRFAKAFQEPGLTLLHDLGRRVRNARLRRNLPAADVAASAGISRTTLFRAEQGHPAVALGTLLRILQVLGLEQDFSRVAADDLPGWKLLDERMPLRARASKRPRTEPKTLPSIEEPLVPPQPSAEAFADEIARDPNRLLGDSSDT